MISNLALLQLMNLVSSALPIGAFAYSQGLEYALDSEWLDSDEKLQQWLQEQLLTGLSYNDGAALLRMMDALSQRDNEQFQHWNHWLLCARETKELWQEDVQVGGALVRLLKSQAIGDLSLLPQPQCSLTAGFAYAAHHFNIPQETALQGYLWSWLENQIAVAAKVMPLGQTKCQALIQQILPLIDQVSQQTIALGDDEIGNSLPVFSLASAMHENQYSRLFRS